MEVLLDPHDRAPIAVQAAQAEVEHRNLRGEQLEYPRYPLHARSEQLGRQRIRGAVQTLKHGTNTAFIDDGSMHPDRRCRSWKALAQVLQLLINL